MEKYTLNTETEEYKAKESHSCIKIPMNIIEDIRLMYRERYSLSEINSYLIAAKLPFHFNLTPAVDLNNDEYEAITLWVYGAKHTFIRKIDHESSN